MSEERHGPEWGLTSVALSAIVILSVLPALNLMATLWSMGFHGLNVQVVAGWGFVGAAIAQTMAIAAVVLGCFDVRAARRAGRPPALGGAGVAMGVFGAVAWAAISVQWLHEVAEFI